MLAIPLSLVTDVAATGSSLVDFLGILSVYLYDLFGAGSSVEV